MDRYTKIVLTLIAFALWANLFVSLSPPGRGLIRDANAQQISRVVIAGSDVPLQVITSPNAMPQPVYLTTDPRNPAATMVVPVNLAQIGSKSFQQGVVLPVDIEGIAGAAVKSSAGLPVTAAQPLAVTAKEPLAVTMKAPVQVTAAASLPVTSTAPLQVIVTRLPASAAVSQSSSAASTSSSGSSSASPGGGPGSN